MNTTFLLIVLVLLAMLIAASVLSRAGRICAVLKPMAGKAVDVRIWGAPIDGFRVHSIRAFSAALLVFLQPVAGGKPTLLKIAQPGAARHDEHGVVIDDARYVQWRRAKMPRVEGQPAVVIHDAR